MQGHHGPTAAQLRRERALDEMDNEAMEISDAVKLQMRNARVSDEVSRAGGAPRVTVFDHKEGTNPRERMLVMAWRPTPFGQWQLAQAVVHRAHYHEHPVTVTVQFTSDQHRCRLPWVSCKPQSDAPEYPTVHLAPGERVPTRAEILQKEQEQDALRWQMGLQPNDPLPGDEDPFEPAQRSLNERNRQYVLTDHWGIPAPTLDALRNRSVPNSQLTGTYGQHFYSNLYKNDFYPATKHAVSETGQLARAQHHANTHHAPQSEQRVVSHRYVPLSGPSLEMDMDNGEWLVAEHNAPEQAWR